jgi:hypothetical protein
MRLCVRETQGLPRKDGDHFVQRSQSPYEPVALPLPPLLSYARLLPPLIGALNLGFPAMQPQVSHEDTADRAAG